MPETSAPDAQSKPSGALLPRLIATGLFSGYAPFAPGTAGSLVALAIYLIPGFEQPVVLVPVGLLMFILGTWSSAVMERILGEDPSVVVVDEIVGMWLTLLLLPKTLTVALAAFVFFRFFDIVKPPPARQLERVPRGWGIMLDDLVAGIYANLCVRGLIFVFPTLVAS